MIKVADVYPITVITYPSGDKSISLILDKHLEDYTPPVRMSELNHELTGQTRAAEGVYAHDVERWLNKKPVID